MSEDIEIRLQKIEKSVDRLLNNSHIQAALKLDKHYDDSIEPHLAKVRKKAKEVADDLDKDPHYALTKYKNQLDKWIYDDYDDTAKKIKDSLEKSQKPIHKWVRDNYDDVATKVLDLLKNPQSRERAGQFAIDLLDSGSELFFGEFDKVIRDVAKQPIEKWNEILNSWKEGSKTRQMVMDPMRTGLKEGIFENYFKKNQHLVSEQMIELETDNELDEKIALEVENELDKLPDGHPAKNPQTAKSFFDLVKRGLGDPEIVEDAIAGLVSDISMKMT